MANPASWDLITSYQKIKTLKSTGAYGIRGYGDETVGYGGSAD